MPGLYSVFPAKKKKKKRSCAPGKVDDKASGGILCSLCGFSEMHLCSFLSARLAPVRKLGIKNNKHASQPCPSFQHYSPQDRSPEGTFTSHPGTITFPLDSCRVPGSHPLTLPALLNTAVPVSLRHRFGDVCLLAKVPCTTGPPGLAGLESNSFPIEDQTS